MTRIPIEGEENSLKDDGFEIRRPVENFSFPFEYRLDPDCWFERNKIASLRALLMSSDDLRFNRQIAVGMLSEAWDRQRFMRDEKSSGADDVDRLYLITWLQHWSTFLGFLSATDLRTIKYLSENGQRRMVTSHFSRLVREEYPVIPFDKVAEETRGLAESGKLVGMFHGSFDPPTFMHLSLANYYHQLCDTLVIGIDGDGLIRVSKAREPRYPFEKRYSVWSSFPNVVDQLVEVPTDIYVKGRYRRERISGFYKELGVGIVFFDSTEPGRRSRIKEIRGAGAIPYDLNIYQIGQYFSSTQLMELKQASGARRLVEILGRG